MERFIRDADGSYMLFRTERTFCPNGRGWQPCLTEELLLHFMKNDVASVVNGYVGSIIYEFLNKFREQDKVLNWPQINKG
ncbi:hypothetical protein QJS10_CPA09g01714 [Acorus calamus]|uniref:Uncharacterized protein n=1 Tax=Acorus calamus TaxID=4465 RepID=A0AAV9E2M3_ACOCL|nr:hypothetical protein QJS10_CPA09g01714 [Acorus calamus]